MLQNEGVLDCTAGKLESLEKKGSSVQAMPKNTDHDWLRLTLYPKELEPAFTSKVLRMPFSSAMASQATFDGT